MELPEPAAELWARTNKAVREHLEQLTGSPSGMRLGGGTVLGAQWHHRLSFDIDITVDERTPGCDGGGRTARRPDTRATVQPGRSGGKVPGTGPRQAPGCNDRPGNRDHRARRGTRNRRYKPDGLRRKQWGAHRLEKQSPVACQHEAPPQRPATWSAAPGESAGVRSGPHRESRAISVDKLRRTRRVRPARRTRVTHHRRTARRVRRHGRAALERSKPAGVFRRRVAIGTRRVSRTRRALRIRRDRSSFGLLPSGAFRRRPATGRRPPPSFCARG